MLQTYANIVKQCNELDIKSNRLVTIPSPTEVLFGWVIQAYLNNKWITVRVASCQSYVTDQVEYDRPGRGLPHDFQCDALGYHWETQNCYLLAKFDLDYRILSARDGGYPIGTRNYDYVTLKELDKDRDSLLVNKKNKLTETLLYLGLKPDQDSDKVRFVYGFSDI